MAKNPTVADVVEALSHVGPTAFASQADYAAFQSALSPDDDDQADDQAPKK